MCCGDRSGSFFVDLCGLDGDMRILDPPGVVGPLPLEALLIDDRSLICGAAVP